MGARTVSVALTHVASARAGAALRTLASRDSSRKRSQEQCNEPAACARLRWQPFPAVSTRTQHACAHVSGCCQAACSRACSTGSGSERELYVSGCCRLNGRRATPSPAGGSWDPTRAGLNVMRVPSVAFEPSRGRVAHEVEGQGLAARAGACGALNGCPRAFTKK